MLHPDRWYLIDRDRSTATTTALVTMEGVRLVETAHVDVRTFIA